MKPQNTMPPSTHAKTVRLSVLRSRARKRRGSKRASRRSYKGTSPATRKTPGVPLAFQAFNRVKDDAEFRGVDSFQWNGNTYHRHEWSNGVPVWKRG